MSFQRYIDLIESTAEVMEQVLSCRVRRLPPPHTGWVTSAPGGGVGALTAAAEDDGSTEFVALGIVGWGFRDGTGLLRALTGSTAACFGSAVSVEVGPSELALGYSTRMKSWMTDPNPADGVQQLLVATMVLSDFARRMAPKLLPLGGGAPASADPAQVARVLSCVMLEKMRWGSELGLLG